MLSESRKFSSLHDFECGHMLFNVHVVHVIRSNHTMDNSNFDVTSGSVGNDGNFLS